MERINKSVCGGVAGKRNTNPKGVFIHNDAGGVNAIARFYVDYLPRHNKANGFAHYYIDKDTIFRAEDTFNKAWHCGNTDGNNNYLSYEVCQSIGASASDFLANERMCLMQVAEDMLYYKIPVNEQTVKLHQEVYATACPHRSVELHGGRLNTKRYFIEEIKKYQKLGTTVEEMLQKDKPNYREQAKEAKQMENNKLSVFGLKEGVYEFDSWAKANECTGLPYVTAGILRIIRTANGYVLEWDTINGRHFRCSGIYGQTKGWMELQN